MKAGFCMTGATQENSVPRPCIAEVEFEDFYKPLPYFNDSFELKVGDRVYVDGKLEGEIGTVTAINYNFKIKVSDYKRIIVVVDTEVHGKFNLLRGHFLTFDPDAIPYSKVRLWLMPPSDEPTISGGDNEPESLENFSKESVPEVVWQKGSALCEEGKVAYLELNGATARAIVMGSRPYEVEFRFEDRNFMNLTCDCFCTGRCKHEVAALLQLRELLKTINEQHAEELAETGYFAAAAKPMFLYFAVKSNTAGEIIL